MRKELMLPAQYPKIAVEEFEGDVDTIVNTIMQYRGQIKRYKANLLKSSERLNQAIKEYL